MNRGIIGAVAALIVIAIIAAGSWYTVDQTERGVRLRYGAVIGTAQPGLGFKVPLMDTVEKVSVKTTTFTWDKMNSYSYDQQPADLSKNDFHTPPNLAAAAVAGQIARQRGVGAAGPRRRRARRGTRGGVQAAPAGDAQGRARVVHRRA